MKQYKLLIIAIIFIPLLSGCLFEDQPVPDPIPYVEKGRTPIEEKNIISYNGNYRPLEYKVIPENNNVLDIMTLKGVMNIEYKKEIGKLQYNYGLKYAGYDINTKDYAKQLEYKDIEPHTIVKEESTNLPYIIKFNTPLKIKDGNNIYQITSVQKISDEINIIDNVQTLNSINTQVKICDPKSHDGSNKDCSTPTGALKYVGRYRIETITCNGATYQGGKDFAGEMTANAITEGSDVNVPITTKIQVSNNSNILKTCLLTTQEQQNNNLHYSKNTYKVIVDPDLSKIFAKMGLNALEESDVLRTIQINYSPKDLNYSDLTFGDNKQIITMRLLIIDNINVIPFKDLDNKPYTLNP